MSRSSVYCGPDFVIGDKVRAASGISYGWSGVVMDVDTHDDGTCWHYLIRWRDGSEDWQVGSDLKLVRRVKV